MNITFFHLRENNFNILKRFRWTYNWKYALHFAYKQAVQFHRKGRHGSRSQVSTGNMPRKL